MLKNVQLWKTDPNAMFIFALCIKINIVRGETTMVPFSVIMFYVLCHISVICLQDLGILNIKLGTLLE